MYFKWNLGDTVYKIINNKVHSAPILSRMIVENKHDNWSSTNEQKAIYTPFGKTCIKYSTVDGIFDEKELFSSKEELLKSL
jgi:hypothetical protein